MTDYRHDLSLSVDDPSLPWNMDLSTAKEVMMIFMRDTALSPEEVEVYAQLGAMVRLGWIEHVLQQQKNAFIRKQKKAQSLAEKGGNVMTPQGSPPQQITHHLTKVLHHMDKAVELAASKADMDRILGFLSDLQKEIDV